MTAQPSPDKQTALQRALDIAESGTIEDTEAVEFLQLCAEAGEFERAKIGTAFQRKFKTFRVKYWQGLVLETTPAPPEIVFGPVEGTDLRAYTLTDDGNADRLIALHGDNLKYCGAVSQWMIWDGRRWQPDESFRIQLLVVSTMKKMAEQSRGHEGLLKHAHRSMSAKAIDATIKLARAKCPADAARFDTNPWLLNFQNGTVDLRTGTLRSHERGDLLTVIIERRYTPDAQAPQWCQFLEWAMGGGPDASAADQDRADRFIAYIQRALGYSLTGSTAEKVIFLLWGPQGNNGKSTMLDIVRMLIGEYGGQMAVGTLMTRKHESNAASSDIAELKGKRFVQTTETKGTQTLDISVLKSLSAGMGEVKGRKMRENWVKFQATHTIWIDMNKPPHLEELDDPAALGRLDLIKFNQHIEPGKEDRQFSERLVKSEGEGILAWIVEGSRLWCQDQALRRPPEVTTEREEWRSEMDTDHPWTGPVERYLRKAETEFKNSITYMEGLEFSFTIEDALSDGVGKKPPLQTRYDEIEMGKIINKLGEWERYRAPRAEGRARRYRRIPAASI